MLHFFHTSYKHVLSIQMIIVLSCWGLITSPPLLSECSEDHTVSCNATGCCCVLFFFLIPSIFILTDSFTGYLWGIDIPSPGNSWASKRTCNFLLDCIWNQSQNAHVTFTQKKGGTQDKQYNPV